MVLCSKVQGVISQSALPVQDGNCVCIMILGMKSSSGVVSACWVSSVALAVTDRLGKNLRTLRQLMWRHMALVGLKLFACYFHPLFPEIWYELDGLEFENCSSQLFWGIWIPPIYTYCIARFFQILEIRRNISKSKLSPFWAEIHLMLWGLFTKISDTFATQGLFTKISNTFATQSLFTKFLTHLQSEVCLWREVCLQYFLTHLQCKVCS